MSLSSANCSKSWLGTFLHTVLLSCCRFTCLPYPEAKTNKNISPTYCTSKNHKLTQIYKTHKYINNMHLCIGWELCHKFCSTPGGQLVRALLHKTWKISEEWIWIILYRRKTSLNSITMINPFRGIAVCLRRLFHWNGDSNLDSDNELFTEHP